jgi:hypothetical protein
VVLGYRSSSRSRADGRDLKRFLSVCDAVLTQTHQTELAAEEEEEEEREKAAGIGILSLALFDDSRAWYQL